MKRSFTRIFLAISGAIACLIGAAVLLIPHTFFATNDITLTSDPNLMSEIRAPGGLLVGAGLIMVSGAVTRSMIHVGLMTAAIAYLMYGLSRVVSLVIDGVPSSSLLGALVVEFVVGLTASALIVRNRNSRSRPRPDFSTRQG